MLSMLIRAATVVFGLLIVSDIARPLSTEEVTIERKTLEFQLDWPLLSDIAAQAYFGDGTKRSCYINLRTYARLNKGDVVQLTFTHTLRSCVSITRDGEVIEAGRFWKWTTGLAGGLLILMGVFGNPLSGRRYEAEF